VTTYSAHLTTDVEQITDEQLDALVDALAPVAGVPSMLGGRLSVQLTVEASTIGVAESLATQAVRDAVRLAVPAVDIGPEFVGVELRKDPLMTDEQPEPSAIHRANFHPVSHPVWAAWRIDQMYGHGLVVGWVRDRAEWWQWHPLIAGAGRGGSAGTPSTYPKEQQRSVPGFHGQTVLAVVVELHPDELTARVRGDALAREYAGALMRQMHAGAKSPHDVPDPEEPF
jgi:hypothetical protein